MEILNIHNLNLEMSGKKLLENVNLEFRRSCVHAIVGPNGAGKSTLAYTIMGLSGYRHASGEIYLNRQSIHHLSIDERARLGMTLGWQEPARFEGLKIKKFLEVSARDNNAISGEEALRAVGLHPRDYMNRALDKTLSGGERKRIELASIFVMAPLVVLLDEPDSGIDIAALDKIFEIIRVLKKRGTTVIMITHSQAVLNRAEHAFLMCRGRIADEGSIEKIGKYFEEKCLPEECSTCEFSPEPALAMFAVK